MCLIVCLIVSFASGCVGLLPYDTFMEFTQTVTTPKEIAKWVEDNIVYKENCQFMSSGPQSVNQSNRIVEADDAKIDTYSDTIFNDTDNCPVNANTDHANADGDLIGDVCDPLTDADNDGADDLTAEYCVGLINVDEHNTDDDVSATA